MSADPNKKSARTFQCRDVLWDTFEQLARELECSVDYLVNEAMKQYARQRSHGATRTPYPTGPSGRESSQSGAQAGPPPIPAPAPAPPAPQPAVALKPPTQPGRVSMPAPIPPPPGRMAPPPGRASAAIPVPPPRASVMPVPPPAARAPTAPPPLPHGPGGAAQMPPIPAAGRAMPVVPTPSPAQRSVPPPPPITSTASRVVPTRDPAANGFPAPAAQPASLTLVYNGERFPVTKDRFVIGRGKQSSDLTLKDPNVSRQHAVVEFQSGTYFMVDMGSTNGVAFNGQRIARRAIAEGDVYKISRSRPLVHVPLTRLTPRAIGNGRTLASRTA